MTLLKEKLRILFASEASFINSGFGNYTRELLNRLYKTNKYELAEFASYGFVNDPRDKDIHWRYYANAVKDNDPRFAEYSSRGDNQFGRWRFDKVVIDFKPHVVIDIRDYWMSSYQEMSPLRSYFNWILMPTVDSAPQQDPWIDTYINADAVFSYSDWGGQVIKDQSNNKVNYIGTTRPGVNLDVFKPKSDIENTKKNLGLPVDSFIIGSVMRNQKRKLFPELMRAFRQLLDELTADGMKEANNTYLYLHTSYPDAGWEIPELLREHRLCNKVFFTYQCARCKSVHADVYSHPNKFCSKCLQPTVKFTSVNNGVSDNILSDIYNTFSLYVQYAICEGAGMPQIEAAACGVPIATINYSAMVDVINKLDAYTIKVGSFFTELETKAVRCYPNNNDFVKIVKKHLRLRPSQIKQKKDNVRRLAEINYNWDNIAKIWENFLDSEHLFKTKKSWNDPINYLNTNIPNNFSKKDAFNIIHSICANNLNDIEKMSSMMMLDMCKDASYGFHQSGMNINGFSYENVLQNLQALINNHNQIERIRSQKTEIQEDFIQYANIKSLTK
jgi:glycosyltransferase involved in cell wall biosynthesis